MKDRNEVIQTLLNGAKSQPPGKYVTVLAEDLVTALTPAPEVTPTPAPESNDQPA